MATTAYSSVSQASYASDTELDVFIPEVWAQAVRASFKKNLVLANTGTDYSSLVSAGGDTIHIPSVADVADVATKATHTAVNYTNATEDKLSLSLTTHKYTSAMVEDMGKVQANSDLLSMYADSIGYKLALGFDVAVETALALTTECIDIEPYNTVAKTIDAATLAHMSKVVMENDCPLKEYLCYICLLYIVDLTSYVNLRINILPPSSSSDVAVGFHTINIKKFLFAATVKDVKSIMSSLPSSTWNNSPPPATTLGRCSPAP